MTFTYNEYRYGGRQMKLSDINNKLPITIKSCNARGLQRERLMSLGFIPGNTVSIFKKGKKNKLSIFEVSKTLVALRIEESKLIEVED